MTLSVSFQEIYDILVAKTGKKILLKTVNDKTVTVGYEQKMRVSMIGTVHKIVWLNITVEKLQNEELHLSYDAGRGGDLLIKILLAIIPTSKYSDYVDIGKDKHVVVHLQKIDKVRQVLQQITVNDIRFQDTTVVIMFNL